MSTRPKAADHSTLRVLYIFEFADSADDGMSRSLLERLRATLPGFTSPCVHGIFTTYSPGGLNPKRLVNLFWVYGWVVMHLLWRPPDAIIVRSSPPGIQIWAAWWASLNSVPVFCWLMDYHPEIEARMLAKRGLGWMAQVLRSIDETSLPRFRAVIVPDRAMGDLVRSRSAGVEVFEHPTWAEKSPSRSPLAARNHEPTGRLCLAYAGNLGKAHNLEPFGALLSELTRLRPVELIVVGGSDEGAARFRRLGEQAGIRVVFRPRVPRFEQLRDVYTEFRVDLGVVLLSDDSAGVVSPSKFSGYIDFGLPLLYVGPPGTNAAEVCTRFGGGFWLSSHASAATRSDLAASIISPDRLEAAAKSARRASEHFASLNQDTLAAFLAPRLTR